MEGKLDCNQMNDDTFIINQLRVGSADAYRYLFDSEYGVMCRFAYHMLHDRAVAESIADDVVYSIWEHRESLAVAGTLRSYLLGAVRYRCINELKARRRRLAVRDITCDIATADEARLLETLFVDVSHPLGTLIEKELEQRLSDGIAKLPDECRRVFEKSRFERKTYREIADETGISVNTVKYHIKRALAFLQEYMRDYLAMIAGFIAFF